jgi:hypothetical protein
LKGEIFYTNLDLHYRYHKIKTRQEDIAETTFRTHEGYYEFLVMSFGHTNAPSTFQILMNYIFKPFLKNNWLVLLDDIIIYNKSWEEHAKHVDMVLKILEEQQLYGNISKCSFAGSISGIFGSYCIS